MGNPETPDPVGDGEYVVEQGECMASIAYENGFLLDSLWNHPGNANLKAGRKDHNVLLPGDRVHIPDKRIRTESCATDNNHQFVLKGVTELLRVVMLDSNGKPRKALPYTIMIKGGRTKSGTTGEDGVIEAAILANARDGELVVHGENGDEHYGLDLGAIDPPSTVTGAQARLNNLGFFCGEVDGEWGPLTEGAIRKFQESQALQSTGKLDDSTRDALAAC